MKAQVPADVDVQDVEDVYRELVRGLGHEHVNDDNVDALIRRADADGHTVLATELREWQASCSAGRQTPFPARKSFNDTTAKR